jgi:hypothetical protein
LRYLTGLLLPFSLSLFLAGCAFTVAQSPETVAPGRIVAGGLASFGPNSGTGIRTLYAGTELGAYGRAGLARNLDAGVRLSIPAGLGADIKYQLLSKRSRLAVGVGASFMPWVVPPLVDSTRRMSIGLYPLIVAGTSRLFGGVRGIGLVHFDRGALARYHPLLGPEFFVGSSLGRGRIRVLPELHASLLVPLNGNDPVHGGDPQLGLGLGLAVQYQLKGGLKDYERLLPGAKDLLDKVR